MLTELRISAIVAVVEGSQRKLGKVQLQKLMYFLQSSGAALDYEYEIYHFGPYSFELARELASLDALGVLRVQNDPHGFGFDISTGKFAGRFKLTENYQRKVDRIIRQFGTDNPGQLEVKATIHFVNSVVKKRVPKDKRKKEVIRRVQALKPKFAEDFIKGCYSDLKELSWI